MPFFKTLKNTEKFEWSSKCQNVFKQLKEHLKSLPTLTSLATSETLFLYLAVAEKTISVVLIKEKSRVQHPVYYVSRALNGPESRYIFVEKLALCLVHAAHRLKPFFLAYPICVKIDQSVSSANFD